MSLQIKKPLSAQAVGTHMYKDGGVNQMKPATKQPEWSTKSLAHYRETEKNDLQRPRCPTSHNAWIWNTWWSVEGHGLTSSAFRSAAHFMMDKRHRGSDLPPVIQSCGNMANLLTAGWNSDVRSLKLMLDRADALRFLIPHSGSWNGSAAVSEQTERTQDQNVSSHAFVFTCGLDSQMRRLERMESELLTSSSTRLQQRAEPLGSPVSGVLVSFGPNLFCATLTADSLASFFFTFRLWTTKTAIIQIIKYFWQFCIN